MLGFGWSLCVVGNYSGWCCTVGGGVSKLEGHLLKLAGKEKSNLPTWRLDLDFVTASLQTTAAVGEGVSRFSGTGLLAVWV